MKFISAIKADRSISQLLGEQGVDSAPARKAIESLKKQKAAIPRIIDAIGIADKSQASAMVDILSSLLDEKTFPAVAAGLGHSDQGTVSAVAWALSSSGQYNPNRLLELLGDESISTPAVIDVLRASKDRLNVQEVLRKAYDLEPREKAALFRIISEIATEALIPDLIARTGGKDHTVRVHLINVLSQFHREDVIRALEALLRDQHKSVRKAAIEALSEMGSANDIQLICSLLGDPDLIVQGKAVDLVVKINHPDTMKYLVEVLKDESEFARRSAVEVLNEIADPKTFKHLLTVISDNDWWVRSRASDALAKIGGPKVISAVLELVSDKDENIRRSAIEILNQTKNQQAVSHLIKATEDTDWWVRERAADALGEIGNPKAIPALSKMLTGEAKSIPAAIRALGVLGDQKALPKILPLLDRQEKEIKMEAVAAVAKLVDSTLAETIKTRLQSLASDGDATIARAASEAVVRIDNKYSTSVIAAGDKAERMAEPAHTLLIDGTDIEKIVQQAEQEAKSDGGAVLDITQLKTGDIIQGRYKYIEQIGKGAFGTVLLVEDTVVQERLILKFLNPNVSSDEETMQRFVHELRYSRKITHKNVIRIYDFLHLDGLYAISMEYFPSHTLGAEISGRKPLPEEKAIRWASDIATGMSVAHQVGIVHRDLKPANLLINDEGLLKIVDFGVAAAASTGDTQLTKTGYVIGSPKYMAPEQILGKKVDFRADVYSLGVIMYEMLTGIPPYSKGDHMAVMYQHVQGKAKLCEELNPNISAPVAAVVKKAMEVDKLNRYSSMDEVHKAISQAA